MATVCCPPPVKFQIVKNKYKGFCGRYAIKISLFFVFSLFIILLADLFYRDVILCYAVWHAFLVMFPIIVSAARSKNL